MINLRSHFRNGLALVYFSANLAGHAAEPTAGKYEIGGSVLDLPPSGLLEKPLLPRMIDSFDIDNDGVIDVKINRSKNPALKFFKDVADLPSEKLPNLEATVKTIHDLMTQHFGPYDPLSAKGQMEIELSGQSLEKSSLRLQRIKGKISQGEALLKEAENALRQPFDLEDLSARARTFLGKPGLSGPKLYKELKSAVKTLNRSEATLQKEVDALNLKADGGIKRTLGTDVNEVVNRTICRDRAALLAAGLRSRNINARCIAFPDHVAVVLPDSAQISMFGPELKKYKIVNPKDKNVALSLSIEGGEILVIDGLEGIPNFPTDRLGKPGEEAQRAKNSAIIRILKGEKSGDFSNTPSSGSKFDPFLK